MKLATLTQTLDGAREREVALSEKIKADEALLAVCCCRPRRLQGHCGALD